MDIELVLLTYCDVSEVCVNELKSAALKGSVAKAGLGFGSLGVRV